MPIPRSNPSITTYMTTANATANPSRSGRSQSMSLFRPPRYGAFDARPHRRGIVLRLANPPPPQHEARRKKEERDQQNRIDDDKQRKRGEYRAGGDRRHRVGGSQQAIHDIGLPPGLGYGPAGQDGEKRQRARKCADDAEPARVVQPAAPAQN